MGFIKRYKRYLICLCLGLMATLLILFGNTFVFAFGDDAMVFTILEVFKTSRISDEEKGHIASEFLFVNTQNAKTLRPVYDVDREKIIGYEAITDRAIISEFIEAVARANNYEYLILNHHFDRPHNDSIDNRMNSALDSLQRFSLPFHINNSGKRIEPFIHSNKSRLMDFESAGDPFFKYHLIEAKDISLPLSAFAMSQGKEIDCGTLTYKMGEQRYFKNFVPRLRLSPHYWNHNPGEIREIGRLLELSKKSSSLFEKSLSNRVIIIGDYNADKVSTLVGSMSSSLVIANIWASLERNDNRFNLWPMLLLILIFSFFSWVIMLDVEPYPKNSWARRLIEVAKSFLGKSFIYTILVIAIFFIFGWTMSVFYIAIFFFTLQEVNKLYKNYDVKT